MYNIHRDGMNLPQEVNELLEKVNMILNPTNNVEGIKLLAVVIGKAEIPLAMLVVINPSIEDEDLLDCHFLIKKTVEHQIKMLLEPSCQKMN